MTNWQDKEDLEIEKMMAQDIARRVANTYFINFRRDMGHVSKRQKERSVEAQS